MRRLVLCYHAKITLVLGGHRAAVNRSAQLPMRQLIENQPQRHCAVLKGDCRANLARMFFDPVQIATIGEANTVLAFWSKQVLWRILANP